MAAPASINMSARPASALNKPIRSFFKADTNQPGSCSSIGDLKLPNPPVIRNRSDMPAIVPNAITAFF